MNKLEAESNQIIELSPKRAKEVYFENTRFTDINALHQLFLSTVLDTSRITKPLTLALTLHNEGGFPPYSVSLIHKKSGLYNLSHISMNPADLVDLVVELKSDFVNALKPAMPNHNLKSIVANIEFFHEWRHLARTYAGIKDEDTNVAEADCERFTAEQIQKIVSNRTKPIVSLPD